MKTPLLFAINRICASTMSFEAFAAMAQRLKVDAIEIRNDLHGIELANGRLAREIAAIVVAHGLVLRSINALQRFEQFDTQRATEARELVRYAQACGAQAVVLCPTNSHQDGRSPEKRHADLVDALQQMQPMLDDHGLTGLVEPLGFEECALRRKSQAARAIEEVGGSGTFALVHDTFHHHLAGEVLLFPELTGLVHISGVEDPQLEASGMRDGDRVLVGPADRLGNLVQLRKLREAGYRGYVSYEPFATQIATATDIEQQLATSMTFVRAALSGPPGA